MTCPICSHSYLVESQIVTNESAGKEKVLECLHSVCEGCWNKDKSTCPVCLKDRGSVRVINSSISQQFDDVLMLIGELINVEDEKSKMTINGDEG